MRQLKSKPPVNNWLTDLFVPLFFDKEFYLVMVKTTSIWFGDEIFDNIYIYIYTVYIKKYKNENADEKKNEKYKNEH